MNNYEYIVASLPDIAAGWKYSEGQSADTILEEIRRDLSGTDDAFVRQLLDGFKDEALTQQFYTEALSSKNRFIREYFRFDYHLRCAKAAFINNALDRPDGTDIMSAEDEDENILFDAGEFEEQAEVATALATEGLLEREKALDDLYWAKVQDLTTFDYFDIEAILGFIARLHIIDRWLKLDEQTGREMFKRLVDEVRGTFAGVTIE